jgi:hypothetical protein
MSTGWCEAYSELVNFVTGHPEIMVKADRVCLPDEVRPGFYRLFDATRAALVTEKLPDLLDEANTLSHNYLKAEQSVTRSLGLESVSMQPSLQRFLHDPVEQLIRELFDPLFDLLKGLIGTEGFEQISQDSIRASFEPLYQSGYEKWVILSLVGLLGADSLFQVTLRKLDSKDIHRARAGTLKEEAPGPYESKHLLFKYDPNAAFIVSDLIVHSAEAKGYISISSQASKALAAASNPDEKRQWRPLGAVPPLEAGTVLLFIGDTPQEISLTADASQICLPDAVLECRAFNGWFEREGLVKVKAYHDSLQPKLGSYVVSREPVPELKPEQQEAGINILTAGFDRLKLEPIISAIKC